ncbi:gamma-glutamyl-gamma-aminobutyrate hydrolase family protein [Tengunoibacter tsumagoiensis]|uniref:Gamma-glutamyl-gamma-aminobutyrate hydrolase n=1 Tax=Tengunoibacter tsumagoiensis TaxID=2014871 RepID=A0A402A169_9CHLR|nr:gamma-glutamyl-gamma-aminobutyrate hydrolase family protein [Tengunoibacter tsumagoiensis]GCE12888.1 gamma-glutamyl-gamma-aminobutyrate hydrolase [Tengunoibacter tsumagoiensis]
MRPLIGIPCRTGHYGRTERSISYNNDAYLHAIEHAGGVPLLIPVLQELHGIQALLASLDGLLLPGGIDVQPLHYQEEASEYIDRAHPQLDALELMLARWAYEQNVPTLGICRGMQVINVALGGSLYQDLASQYPGSLFHANWDQPRNQIIHTIELTSGSRMEKILGVGKVAVNSLHHQAVKVPGKDVVITGRAEDGVAELLEVTGRRFMLAAQCHPEELFVESTPWARLFQAFTDAASLKVQPLTAPVEVDLLAS